MGIIKEGGAGRPRVEVIYKDIDYNGLKYIILSILKNGNNYSSIIDYEDGEKVKKYSWHIASENYVASTVYIDKIKKELYLHNFIMNRLTFEGKGQIETVDHINRNPLDNRKKNLRFLSQSEQNLNQKTKERKIIFPEDFPIKANDIPKHIWYVKANGGHGDRFAIEFKTENLIWKGTSSKKVKIEDKLFEAKEKLKEFYILFPYLNPENQDRKKEIDELQKEYEDIIALI
jgi:hypothetical protein